MHKESGRTEATGLLRRGVALSTGCDGHTWCGAVAATTHHVQGAARPRSPGDCGFRPAGYPPAFSGRGSGAESQPWPLVCPRTGREAGGLSSNAFVVPRVGRGRGSTSSSRRGCIAAGSWRRKRRRGRRFSGRRASRTHRADLRLLVTRRRGSGRRPDGRGLMSSSPRRSAGTAGVGEIDHAEGVTRWFPKRPIQRRGTSRPELRRSELVLFAVAGSAGSRPASKAQRLRVRVGQPLAEASAVNGRPAHLPADVAADAPGVNWHRGWLPPAGRSGRRGFSHSPLGDVTGCTHLWGGEGGLQAVRDVDSARLSSSCGPGRTGGASRSDRRGPTGGDTAARVEAFS